MSHEFDTCIKIWCLVIILVKFGNCTLKPGVNNDMTKEDCNERTINGMKCTYCANDTTSLQVNVKMLVFELGPRTCLYTHNLLIAELNANTFAKSTQLTHLYLIRNGFPPHFDSNMFSPLNKLLFLNLSFTNMFENSEISWPNSLRILDITKLPTNALGATNLEFLEVLNVSDTKITEFPNLHELAPLKILVLHRVNMTNFKIEDLAKSCKLESIDMEDMSLGPDNCNCIQIRAWAQQHEIELYNVIDCKPDTKKECAKDFSETSINNWRTCVDRTASHKTYYFIIGGSILLLLVILCGSAILYNKLIKQEEEEGILGITDEELMNFTPHPHHTTAKASEVSEEENFTEDEAE